MLTIAFSSKCHHFKVQPHRVGSLAVDSCFSINLDLESKFEYYNIDCLIGQQQELV